VLLAGKVSAAAVGGGTTTTTGLTASLPFDQANINKLIHKIPRYFIA
jgi:hypothetical protein